MEKTNKKEKIWYIFNGVNITIDEDNKTYKIENNIIYSKDGTVVYYSI